MEQRLRQLGWAVAIALGAWAELTGHPPLHGLDALTGVVLLAGAAFAARFAPRSAAGTLSLIVAGTWFLGTLASWAVFLHRAAVAQLIVTHPARRVWPASTVERAAVATAYGYALIAPATAGDAATIGFAVALLALAGWRLAVAGDRDRSARAVALTAASALSAVLIISATRDLTGGADSNTLLAVYEITVMLCVTVICMNVVWAAWARPAATAVVLELGDRAAGTLREQLARALADPGLRVGYWIEERSGYYDDEGRPLSLPDDSGPQIVTPIEEAGARLAVIIHSPALTADPRLFEAIAASVRLAVSNARLNAEVRAIAADVAASRLRLLEAADRQRGRLADDLRDGAGGRLARVGAILAEGGPPLEPLRRGLQTARAELDRLASGVHPQALSGAGLRAALDELAGRSPTPVSIQAPSTAWPPSIETATYFVCSEALTNIAKYAVASHASIDVTAADGELRVAIADDGIGGADPARGSGLRGLADRVEALGGRLTIESPPGGGTRLLAEIPIR